MSHHTSHPSTQARPAASPSSPSSPLSPSTIKRSEVKSASEADIAERAYGKYEARGFAHGFDREDWAAASRELVAETFGHLSNPSLSPSQHTF